MTKAWNIPQFWQGQEVAILAAGPSMSQATAERVRHLPCIAVNEAIRVAPWATMLVALDRDFWLEDRPFDGLRVCGVPCDVDALYAGMWPERVTLAPGHVIEIHNSGLAAIRIAARAGASKITLAGFEPESGRNFYDDETRDYAGVAQGLAAIIAELGAAGVVVEHLASEAEAEHGADEAAEPATPARAKRK